MMDSVARRMRDAAVGYARHGFRVFPLARGSKSPLAGLHADKDAINHPESVAKIWEMVPGANIGWALRFHPGVFVLDIDFRSGGDEWLARRPPLPPTVKVLTSSGDGSAHYWLRKPHSLAQVKCPALPDTCGRAEFKGLMYGFVLLPPSEIRGKSAYSFERSPRDAAIHVCPEWLESEIWHFKRPKPFSRETPIPMRVSCYKSIPEFFREAGNLGPQIRPGVWAAKCPNESGHSGPKRRFAGDTTVHEPTRTGGRGWLYCAHAGCANIMNEMGL